MCSDALKYLFFLILFFVCVIRMTTGLNNYQICKDQSQCISLKSCKPYMDLLRTLERPLTPPVAAFLRSRECGFQEDYPKVCCSLIPKDLPIWNNAGSELKPRINKSEIKSNDLSSSGKPQSTTAKYTPEQLKEKLDAINKAFDLSDLFDFTGSYDLFRRKRFDSNSSIDIEIR